MPIEDFDLQYDEEYTAKEIRQKKKKYKEK